MVEWRAIIKDANVPEFAAITGGLLLSEYLEKPMTEWGFDADTKVLARVLGGEVVAYALNAFVPEFSPYKSTTKTISYLFTAVAADGAKRYIAPKIGIAGPTQVIIRQAPAPTPRTLPAPSPAPVQKQPVQPAIKVGTELSDDELRNLGFLR